MSEWLASAKLLISKLELRSDKINDQDLILEVQMVADLIRKADSEEKSSVPEEINQAVVGQSANISKLFRISDIAFCQSNDKKVFITDVAYKVYNTAKSLKDIERCFDDLIRINQSTIINRAQIKCIEHNEQLGYYGLRLINNQVFKVSRRCYKNIKDLFRLTSEIQKKAG